MSNEEKELLLKDLCARLPYGVIIFYANGKTIEKRELGLGSLHDFMFDNADIKPYLRPMSSMTEEEKKEYDKLFTIHSEGEIYCENWEWMDFMNSHHFDYRGLIPMGLALEAPKDMYNI